MSLERVVDEILERGRQEAQAIEESARREREELLAEAEKEGEALVAERARQAQAEAERERTRETARAELEARKIVLRAQKELLDEVLEAAKERLRSRKDHEALLQALTEAYRGDVEGSLLRSNARDASSLRRLSGAEVRNDLDCLGGFVIESGGGSLRIDLTYESFLEEVWEDSVRELADTLWGEA